MGGRFALLIATSHYKDKKFSRLATPASDVQALRDVLVDVERGGFTVSLLLNRSHEKIRCEIDRFFKARRHDDVVLFYFSGHGIRDIDGQLCMTATDTEMDLLWSTSVSADDLKLKMDRCDSGQQIVILDCCYSGAFTQGSKGAGGECTGLDLFSKGQGRIVLTASDATQLAWESDSGGRVRGCSIFTECLVEGLKTGDADINHDGIVTIDEWYDYTYEKVRERCRQEESKRFQTPLKHGTQKGDIVIARNPHAKHARISIDPRIQELLTNPFPEARVAAVKMLNRQLDDIDLARRAYAQKELESIASTDDSRIVSSAARQCLRNTSASGPVISDQTENIRKLQSNIPVTAGNINRQVNARSFRRHRMRPILAITAIVLAFMAGLVSYYTFHSSESSHTLPMHIVPIQFESSPFNQNNPTESIPLEVTEDMSIVLDPPDERNRPLNGDASAPLREQKEHTMPPLVNKLAQAHISPPVLNTSAVATDKSNSRRKKIINKPPKKTPSTVNVSIPAEPIAPANSATPIDNPNPPEKETVSCPGCAESDLVCFLKCRSH